MDICIYKIYSNLVWPKFEHLNLPCVADICNMLWLFFRQLLFINYIYNY